MNSPMYFCPPTPANTPQLSENNKNGSESVNVSPFVVAESFGFSQILDQQEEIEETVEKHLITKLFKELPEEIEGYESSLDDKDDASVWSMQVNASTCDELEDFEEFGAIYDDGDVDKFCDVMSEICMNDGAEFSVKDERLVNDIDCEIKGDS
ncbi:hypothetical protein CTI12_AA409420 [Artemisia annua]|uniref:Uncharacterized protein n=1 Tax=Artemisia annua TaxID=35608 RepID=A0A2U1M7P6_ARTAN|nr:hypothetical protein CTI12_AA409420 [Artemisia annua]